jgi:hypothetical protein
MERRRFHHENERHFRHDQGDDDEDHRGGLHPERGASHEHGHHRR